MPQNNDANNIAGKHLIYLGKKMCLNNSAFYACQGIGQDSLSMMLIESVKWQMVVRTARILKPGDLCPHFNLTLASGT